MARLENDPVYEFESMSGPGKKDVPYAKQNERYFGREQKTGKEKQVAYGQHDAVTHSPVAAAYENTLTYVSQDSCHFSLLPV